MKTLCFSLLVFTAFILQILQSSTEMPNNNLTLFPKFTKVERLSNIFEFFGEEMDEKILNVLGMDILKYKEMLPTFIQNLPHCLVRKHYSCPEDSKQTHTQIEENVREQVDKDATLLGLNNLLIKQCTPKNGRKTLIISRTGIIQSGHRYFIIRRNLSSDSLKWYFSERTQHFRFFEIADKAPYVSWDFHTGKMEFWIHADIQKYFNINLDNHDNEFNNVGSFIRSRALGEFFLNAKQSFDVPHDVPFAIRRKHSMIENESTFTPIYSKTSPETKSSTPRNPLIEENKSDKYPTIDVKKNEKSLDEKNRQKNDRNSLSKVQEEQDLVNSPLNGSFNSLNKINKIQFLIAARNISPPPGFEKSIQNLLMSENEIYENEYFEPQKDITSKQFKDKYPALAFLKKEDSEFFKLFHNSTEETALQYEKYLVHKKIFN